MLLGMRRASLARRWLNTGWKAWVHLWVLPGGCSAIYCKLGKKLVALALVTPLRLTVPASLAAVTRSNITHALSQPQRHGLNLDSLTCPVPLSSWHGTLGVPRCC